MKKIKCYGRNKVSAVKLEKSMIRRFFDGSSLNCSSTIYGSAYKDQAESISNKENVFCGDVPSIHLFEKSNVYDLTKNVHLNTVKKKQVTTGTAAKSQQRAGKKGLKFKKNAAATKDQCKEPCWSEIEKHEFVFEQVKKIRKVKVSDAQKQAPILPQASSNFTSSKALNTSVDLFSNPGDVSKSCDEKSLNSLENIQELQQLSSESLRKLSGPIQFVTSKSSNCYHSTPSRKVDKASTLNSVEDRTVSCNSKDLFDSSSGLQEQEKGNSPAEQSINRILRSASLGLSQNCESIYCSSVGETAITSTPLIKPKYPVCNLFNSNLVLSPLVKDNRIFTVSHSQLHKSGCYAPSPKLHLSRQRSRPTAADFSSYKVDGLAVLFKEKSPVSHVCSNPENLSQAILSRILSSSAQDLSSVIQDPVPSDELTKKDLLALCNQKAVIPFNEAYCWGSFKIKKIGEGTYGEVFMISKKKTSSVLKIIPVSQKDNNYQNFKNVLSEVKISKCLSDLRKNKVNQTKSFIKMNRACMVCGEYPQELIEAWDDFGEEKSTYNARPDFFDESQVFIILDLEYGGKDLSCFVLRDALEAESVLKQITLALAVAEEAFLFEHRDLHLGNILVQRNKSKTVSFKLRGETISFESRGLHVTLIDFTLSRLHEDGYVFYYDLADDVSLFNQSGDIQFEVYRKMKDHLRNQWEECVLYSNVLWLNFLCVKLLEFEYSRPSSAKHKNGLSAIINFQQKLNNNSALECLEPCGISSHGFQFDINRGKNSSKNSILVSRNSYRK